MSIFKRTQKVVESLLDNESLAEHLETGPAQELLDWGFRLARHIVASTAGLDDVSAEATMQPRLRALRQMMRGASLWAAGKYSAPEDRARLRDRLIQYAQAIYGGTLDLAASVELDNLLQQAAANTMKPLELVQALRALFERMQPPAKG